MVGFDDEMKIEVKVDEEVAAGKFSNYTNIAHSPDEFILDFLFVQPTPPPGFGKLMSRVILTPGHAKRLLELLNNNIDEYEKNFGSIKYGEKNDSFGGIQ